MKHFQKISMPQTPDESLARVRDLSEHKLRRSCKRDFNRVKVSMIEEHFLHLAPVSVQRFHRRA